eukprot:628999-Pelagomonas_calceolata.AAC.3
MGHPGTCPQSHSEGRTAQVDEVVRQNSNGNTQPARSPGWCTAPPMSHPGTCRQSRRTGIGSTAGGPAHVNVVHNMR